MIKSIKDIKPVGLSSICIRTDQQQNLCKGLIVLSNSKTLPPNTVVFYNIQDAFVIQVEGGSKYDIVEKLICVEEVEKKHKIKLESFNIS